MKVSVTKETKIVDASDKKVPIARDSNPVLKFSPQASNPPDPVFSLASNSLHSMEKSKAKIEHSATSPVKSQKKSIPVNEVLCCLGVDPTTIQPHQPESLRILLQSLIQGTEQSLQSLNQILDALAEFLSTLLLPNIVDHAPLFELSVPSDIEPWISSLLYCEQMKPKYDYEPLLRVFIAVVVDTFQNSGKNAEQAQLRIVQALAKFRIKCHVLAFPILCCIIQMTPPTLLQKLLDQYFEQINMMLCSDGAENNEVISTKERFGLELGTLIDWHGLMIGVGYTACEQNKQVPLFYSIEKSMICILLHISLVSSRLFVDSLSVIHAVCTHIEPSLFVLLQTLVRSGSIAFYGNHALQCLSSIANDSMESDNEFGWRHDAILRACILLGDQMRYKHYLEMLDNSYDVDLLNEAAFSEFLDKIDWSVSSAHVTLQGIIHCLELVKEPSPTMLELLLRLPSQYAVPVSFLLQQWMTMSASALSFTATAFRQAVVSKISELKQQPIEFQNKCLKLIAQRLPQSWDHVNPRETNDIGNFSPIIINI